MSKKKILVVGSLNMDIVITMKNMPLVGETILGEKLSHVSGGKGANQACAAASMNGDVTMLGCIGNDDFGDTQLRLLSERGVKVEQLKRVDNLPTGTAVIYVNAQGNNSIVVVAGANSACDSAFLATREQAFMDADYLLLQMEIPTEAITYAIKRAKELNKTVILNPAPAPEHLSSKLLAQLDYITPNETELLKLTGLSGTDIPTMTKGAGILLKRGVKNVLVTLGDRGALHVNADGSRLYPTRKVKAVDTTAAGDCFNGAFVVGLSEGMSAAEAIRFANIASSITVTRAGAQQSIPTREETDSVLAKTEVEKA